MVLYENRFVENIGTMVLWWSGRLSNVKWNNNVLLLFLFLQSILENPYFSTCPGFLAFSVWIVFFFFCLIFQWFQAVKVFPLTLQRLIFQYFQHFETLKPLILLAFRCQVFPLDSLCNHICISCNNLCNHTNPRHKAPAPDVFVKHYFHIVSQVYIV